MKNKLIATKLSSYNSLFLKYTNQQKIDPNINNYFKFEFQHDYINEFYNFYNAIQKYQTFKQSKGNTKKLLSHLKPVKNFLQRYPHFNELFDKLSDKNKAKIKATMTFRKNYNAFISSKQIKKMTHKQIYENLLLFQIEFFLIIGKESHLKKIPAIIKNLISSIEKKT